MPDLTGTHLGSYRILEPLGRGGMATVYKAYQPGTDRLVALKVLRDQSAQDLQIVRRFQQEARVIARLEHPNIVPVYDSGEENGTLYLVMRYIRAGTVQDVLERGPLSAQDACGLLTEIASALDYAHAMGVIHRDIKPNNILVDTLGHAYLTDFGVAKVLDGTGELTSTSVTLGTPAYMAPEQVMARPVTPQTDIYALGVTLYEMLTGQPPFAGDSPIAIAMMHLREPLPPPRQVNPAISFGAELVVVRAMAKDPDDRYQTAGDMAAALAQSVSVEAYIPPARVGAPSLEHDPTILGADRAATFPLSGLVAVAAEIAGTKSAEEVTPDLRREIQKQERSSRRRRLLTLVPWIIAGLLVAGLTVALAITLNSNFASRTSAAQTATAVGLLLNELSSAQTAIAGGGQGLEPTLEYLQTQIAAASAPGTTVTVVSTPSRPAATTQTPTPKSNASAPAGTPTLQLNTPPASTAQANTLQANTSQPNTQVPNTPPPNTPAPTKAQSTNTSAPAPTQPQPTQAPPIHVTLPAPVQTLLPNGLPTLPITLP